MSDRIDDLVAFLWELGLPTKKLKKIRVQPYLYREILNKYNSLDIPLILREGRPQAFIIGIPVDCDETLTHAFELDYAP